MRHQHKRHPHMIPASNDVGLDRYHAPPEFKEQPIKGRRDRRIIGREILNGRQYDLHATKGYRSTRT